MTSLFADTAPEAEQCLIEGYRRMPAWRKLQCITDLNMFLRQAQLAQIQKAYPDADEHELKLRLAARWIEPELLKKAFGWEPEKEWY